MGERVPGGQAGATLAVLVPVAFLVGLTEPMVGSASRALSIADVNVSSSRTSASLPPRPRSALAATHSGSESQPAGGAQPVPEVDLQAASRGHAQHQRARALAIFSLGVPLGLAAGTLIGAYLAHWINWRAAFLAMGVAGSPVYFRLARSYARSELRSEYVTAAFALGASRRRQLVRHALTQHKSR